MRRSEAVMRRPNVEVSKRGQTVPILIAVLAAAVIAYGVRSEPERTWPNLLLDGFYVLSLSVSAMFFLASTRLTGARWSAGLRRVPEALMLTIPVAAALLAIVFFGRETLYVWAEPGGLSHEHGEAGRKFYLEPGFAFARMFLTLVVWGLFAWMFRRASIAQDGEPAKNLEHHSRLNKIAAAFIIVFAILFTLGAYDWIISLDPTWFSTMFGVYVFAGSFVQGIAAITLAVVMLRERGALREVATEHQLHDLGKMLFAFSIFWAYIWVCQYLLIWYGNIPEEVTHYLKRTNGPWLFLFALNFIVNWLVPFVVLMPVRAKKDPRVLRAVSVLLLVGRWLDWYLLIMPSVWSAPHIGPIEVAVAAGYAAIVWLLFVRNLSRAPLVPTNDPILAAERLQGAH